VLLEITPGKENGFKSPLKLNSAKSTGSALAVSNIASGSKDKRSLSGAAPSPSLPKPDSLFNTS
jgi:hypothetical protein